MIKILLDDIRKVIIKEYKADCDFVSGGCIVRKGSFFEYETPYPLSHHIDEEDKRWKEYKKRRNKKL